MRGSRIDQPSRWPRCPCRSVIIITTITITALWCVWARAIIRAIITTTITTITKMGGTRAFV